MRQAAMADVSSRSIESRHDGARVAALEARAQGPRRGAVVVLQEIFGLSAHVGEMCAWFAEAGFDALAPGLFERVEPGFAAGHDAEGFAKGRAAVAATPWAQALGDIQSAINLLTPPVFAAGFCYGGTAAWLTAARCSGLSAAAGFYGRLIKDFLDDAPRVPVMLHYGARDASIPAEDVALVRAAYPQIEIHVYDAGHGFCRRDGPDYDPACAALALTRTLALFDAAHG